MTAQPTAWVEVNLSALRHNVQQVRQILGENCALVAVVKANAYGHGLVETAKAFASAGADALAVSSLEEGLALREAGVASPILLLMPLLPEQLPEALAARLQVTLTSLEQLAALSAASEKSLNVARAQLYVETGFGNGGLSLEALESCLQQAQAASRVKLVGLYSHLSNALDQRKTHRQVERFQQAQALAKAYLPPDALFHLCASLGVLRLGSAGFNAVRCGTLLYGQAPIAGPSNLDLRPALALKSRLVHAWIAGPGEEIGYHGEFRLHRPKRLGLVPVGYSTGVGVLPVSRLGRPRALLAALKTAWQRFRRSSSGLVEVIAGDERLPVVGRLAMNHLVVDLSAASALEVGTEVTLPVMWALLDSDLPRKFIED